MEEYEVDDFQFDSGSEASSDNAPSFNRLLYSLPPTMITTTTIATTSTTIQNSSIKNNSIQNNDKSNQNTNGNSENINIRNSKRRNNSSAMNHNKKTREELNEMEKQRTKRISSHFDSLRTLLQNANIETKKDKFSVLKNSYDYILKLRHNLHLMELEMSKIYHSNKLHFLKQAESSSVPVPVSSSTSTTSFPPPSIPFPLTGHHHQFKKVFMKSSVAMSVTKFDGQFLTCNDNFLRLSGYSRLEYKSKTIFDCIVNEQSSQLHSILQNYSSSDQQPQQILLTFQFSEMSDKIQLLSTVWPIQLNQIHHDHQEEQQQESLSNEESNYFQFMFLPVANDLKKKLNLTSQSTSFSSLLSTTGISSTASQRFPLPDPPPPEPPPPPPTLQYNFSPMKSSLNDHAFLQSTSFLSYHEVEDKSEEYSTEFGEFTPRIISTVTEQTLSNDDRTSFISSPQMILNENNITFPLAYFPAFSIQHSHHLEYQPPFQLYCNNNSNNSNNSSNEQNNYSHDDSDETFENIRDNWFDQDCEEEFEDDS